MTVIPRCASAPVLTLALASGLALGLLAAHANAADAATGAAALAQNTPPAEEHPRTCLVLSGGGARGLAHIGVLEVLEELHVPIDCIAGTSMGAIIGGAYAAGADPADIERLVREIDWNQVLMDATPREQRSVRARELERLNFARAEFGVRGTDLLLPLGAVAGRQLAEVLRELSGTSPQLVTFDELPVPFRAVATDIESGRMVVMENGSMTTAMRASMSVPGVFAPQERDGRLLVDGGLVRNLPIDVARAMGAERIIAINLGTPLMKRADLQSLLGVAEQMLNILTEQNVGISLAELRPGDQLIEPALEGFSSMDYGSAHRIIEIGVRTARAAAASLAAFAVPPEQYARYRAQRGARGRETQMRRVTVDTSGLEQVNPRSVAAVLGAAVHRRGAEPALETAVDALYATDDFEAVDLRATGNTAAGLVIHPREKSWGPTYARFGLTLSTDGEGKSAFNLLTDLRATWLNSRALEWRATASIGELSALHTELVQPLDLRRRWFATAGAVLEQRIESLFFENQAIGSVRSRSARGSLGFGRYVGRSAEARVAYAFGRQSLRSVTGIAFAPEAENEVTALRATLVLDRLDDWSFPRAGHFLAADISIAESALGGDLDYERYQLDLQKAFGFGRHAINLATRLGDSTGEAIPFVEAFSLGGFQALSGAAERRYLGHELLFGRALYRYRLGGLEGAPSRWYLGGSLEAGRIHQRINGRNEATRLAASIFAAADTIIGPLYIGGGFAEGGDRSLYLFLGRP